MRESDAMKWVRQVRDEISTEIRGLSPKQRIEYLKEQSKKAKPPAFILEAIKSWIVGKAAYPAYLVTILR